MQKARGHPIARAPTVCKRMVSGTISLRCLRFFSPFPRGTCSLSVSQEYLALPDGAGRFPQGVSDPVVLRILLGSEFISHTGLSPSMEQLSRSIPL